VRIFQLATPDKKFGLHPAVNVVWHAPFDNLSSHVFPIRTVERRRHVLAGRDLKAGGHIQSVACSRHARSFFPLKDFSAADKPTKLQL
jgi:hypothetical protein